MSSIVNYSKSLLSRGTNNETQQEAKNMEPQQRAKEEPNSKNSAATELFKQSLGNLKNINMVYVYIASDVQKL